MTGLVLARRALAAAVVTFAFACGPSSGDSVPARGSSALEEIDDRAIGAVDAPVVIIEYASPGCGTCAYYHTSVFPDLKAKYIDTGQVRYVFREMRAGDPVMFGTGALLARCVAEDKYYPVIDTLYTQFDALRRAQRDNTARQAYLRIARSANLSEEDFDACLNNQALLDEINARGEDGRRLYGITGTPGFVINGVNIKDLAPELAGRAPTLADFEAILAVQLGEEPSDAPQPVVSEQ